MRSTRWFALLLGAVLLAAPSTSTAFDEPSLPEPLGETNVLAELAGNRFHGTWWLSFGPPPQRGLILTLTRSGTFTLEDSFGKSSISGNTFTQTQGIWRRSGPRSAQALGLRFVRAADGSTFAVERIRLELSFAGGLNNISGEVQFEEMLCETEPSPLPFDIQVCPDPTTAPTEVLRGPGPFSGVRLELDDPE